MKQVLLIIVVISKVYLNMNLPKIGKKAGQPLTESIVFLILNIFFFSAVLFFVWRSTSESVVVEEAYAKKLGLMIDEMRPGTEVNISVKDLYKVMEKNDFSEFPIHVENSTITVKVIAGEGYSYRFFSSVSPRISINQNDENKLLSIKT